MFADPDAPAACEKCGKPGDIGWCPAWEQWLCGGCRLNRAEIELRGPSSLPAPLPSWLAAHPEVIT
jgi:hypothetical protein